MLDQVFEAKRKNQHEHLYDSVLTEKPETLRRIREGDQWKYRNFFAQNRAGIEGFRRRTERGLPIAFALVGGAAMLFGFVLGWMLR